MSAKRENSFVVNFEELRACGAFAGGRRRSQQIAGLEFGG